MLDYWPLSSGKQGKLYVSMLSVQQSGSCLLVLSSGIVSRTSCMFARIFLLSFIYPGSLGNRSYSFSYKTLVTLLCDILSALKYRASCEVLSTRLYQTLVIASEYKLNTHSALDRSRPCQWGSIPPVEIDRGVFISV